MRSDNFKMKFNVARAETRLSEDYLLAMSQIWKKKPNHRRRML